MNNNTNRERESKTAINNYKKSRQQLANVISQTQSYALEPAVGVALDRSDC